MDRSTGRRIALRTALFLASSSIAAIPYLRGDELPDPERIEIAVADETEKREECREATPREEGGVVAVWEPSPEKVEIGAEDLAAVLAIRMESPRTGRSPSFALFDAGFAMPEIVLPKITFRDTVVRPAPIFFRRRVIRPAVFVGPGVRPPVIVPPGPRPLPPPPRFGPLRHPPKLGPPPPKPKLGPPRLKPAGIGPGRK